MGTPTSDIRYSVSGLVLILLLCACFIWNCAPRASLGLEKPYAEHLREGDRVVLVLYDEMEYRGTVTALYEDGVDVQLYPGVNEEFKWAGVKEIRLIRRGEFQ